METEIKLAVKLEECRDTASRFFREEYAEKLKPYTKMLTGLCNLEKKETLEGLITCLQLESVIGNGMAQMMFCAAACEILEPSEEYLNQTKEQ